jgi:hypothetical protein
MKIESKARRFAIVFTAGTVALLSLGVVSKAVQTIEVPNQVDYGYTLAGGANSAAITPITNQAVFVMGCQTTIGYRGIGSVTLLHVPSSFIEWVGLESPAGAAITQGFSGTAGTHILYLDYSHLVDVRVAGPDTILIHNGNSITQTGDLKLIW